MKFCAKCRKDKEYALFSPNPRMLDGRSSWCRACANAATKSWRDRHREEYNESRRVAPSKLTCTECNTDFEGRKGRLVCSRRCKDNRYARRHPVKAGEKARRHQRRVRARRKAALTHA